MAVTLFPVNSDGYSIQAGAYLEGSPKPFPAGSSWRLLSSPNITPTVDTKTYPGFIFWTFTATAAVTGPAWVDLKLEPLESPPLGILNVKDFGADPTGLIDSVEAIQTAIDKAGDAGGGIVFLPAGTYSISSSLIVNYSSITLQGVGPSFTISGSPLLAEPHGGVIQPSATFPSGDYLVVCNSTDTGSSQVSGFTVRDLTLYCAALSGGVIAYAPEKALVSNVVVQSHVKYGIRLESVGSSGDSGRIIDCFVDGGSSESDGGIWNSVYESAIIGCETILCGGTGSLGTDASIVALNSVGIVACCTDTSRGDAFRLGENCTLTGSRTFNSTGNCGVRLMGDGATAIGNQFGDCGSAGSGSYNGAAILCDVGSNVVVEGNTVLAGSGTSYAVYDNTGSVVSNNVFSGTFGSGAMFTNTGGHYSHNVGYNPVGALPAPSVPSSGTAVTNTFGVDATVYVAGGTVTAIDVAGTSTGMTSGPVRVAAGQTITLTYSAAPTWTWFGD